MSAATNMICHDDDDTVDDTRYTDGDTWYTWWYDGDTDDENDDGYNEDLYIYMNIRSEDMKYILSTYK